MRAVDEKTAQALIAEYNAKAKWKLQSGVSAIGVAGEMLTSLVILAVNICAAGAALYGFVRFVKWAWEN